MSILFCTPMYGGMCTEAYFKSCIGLQSALIQTGVEYDWYTGVNESLVTRARNACVHAFLKDTAYRYMMFIDADIGFAADDVAKLWNLQAPVAVAAYAMKTPAMPKLSAWVDGRLVGGLDKFKEPVAVDYAGTGFMMISRDCLEKMCAAYPETRHMEGPKGEERFALFDTEIVEDGGKRFYASEDYLFCRRWRKLGGEVLLEPTIRLQHMGSFAYEGKS
ncbi:MAG: hypothetical protein KGZ69_05945 [Methylomonas sp.]|nr:hypothetical protein [Methylomonas sp.]